MGRNSASPDRVSSGEEDDDNNAAASTTTGIGFHSIRDRIRFKRNPNPNAPTSSLNTTKDRPSTKTTSDRRRSHHHSRPASNTRKFLLFPFRGRSLFYFCLFFAVFVFALASMVLQSSIASMVFRMGSGSERKGRSVREGLKFGSSLQFVPRINVSLDRARSEHRLGVRPPRLALVLGNMKNDPVSLMLYTVVKSLQELGYLFKIYAVDDGKARSIWEKVGGQIIILSPERYHQIDWLIFEGVIVDSLKARAAISSLMQEPFCSVPLVWAIQEDTLANRLPLYEDMGWERLISFWRSSFSRADVIVFPDFSLPMLYSVLDTGNFFVIPGSPIDVWAAESYSKSRSKMQLRTDNGFNKDDMLVLVVGSSFFYNDLSWDYAVAMHDIGPLLLKYARGKDSREAFKFLFLGGNSTEGYSDALQEIATRLGFHHGSVRHYGMNGDVNRLLLMADIVLYGSSQDVQGFPPLLTRAMSFGIPVIAPDYPVIKKYVVDGVHGMIYPKHQPDALKRAFSLLISKGKLSKFAHSVASSGRLLAKNMQASDCVTGYAKLLENVLTFPSGALLPGQISKLKQGIWEWNLFSMGMEQGIMDQNVPYMRNSSIVYALEEQLTNHIDLGDGNQSEPETLAQDIPTDVDWDILREIENSEELESLEMEEIEERMEKDSGVWDEIYRNARKAEKLKSEGHERDEGELERTGQALCIYEIYDGAGAWPFLHHGSLYRGLSLSTRAQRMRSDDVDAVGRLPLLNESYYRDILCEIGGMFAIANSVDNVHKRLWIGFQSWRAGGRKVSLSTKAEQVLEEKIREETKGDVIYFWAHFGMDSGLSGSNDALTFWSTCDILNGGNCRTAFEGAFRRMYALPSHIEALPPMPEDGGHWSALHSWVMPTPSFLEFIMFSRMFADSLNSLHTNSSKITACLLSSSNLEEKHCYCRILELLVNVWAYHSARKMVYINPHTGSLQEQHPIEQRKGYMWAKYFSFTLLKSMDEDLAEAADDDDHPSEMWLWPRTGEVYWQGVYEREREERYRLKMDKKRKTKEKLLERMQNGYIQKPLGRRKLKK
ncbi:hypothetical protein Vadar_009711 [Vaccinium darrowii]|uniref:Uncharacterized protein n=1 Tax=Vaccinium darrowii TaxID=229202 RepID=A0ACB7XGG4_9ERIC|nr:hypothetical protein Vadar_009711 [Vaccinium darrowii]